MTGAFTPSAAGQMRADTDAVLARVDAGMLRVLTRHPEPCPDCDGSGVEGDEVYQGEFQPPERDPCSSCGGSRVATPYVAPIPTGTATDSDFAALIEAARDDPLRRHFEDDDTCTCDACDGEGRIAVGEFGGDCAAIHGMGGRLPDPPGWERCEACDGTGRAAT